VISAPDIPGHTVTGVLGSGGFATVYQTWQVAVGRETAVKVDSRVLHTERDQRRFFREVTAAGRLSGHPHVVDVYDAGTLRDGRPFLVMELCPGGSLNDQLKRNGPMNPELVCRIGTSLADALAAAHSAGILHRDIKPANILVNRYGVVGLSDFGLASIIAASGEQSVSRDALTPAYAPPESFHEAEPTAAADLYSLAATLYALMAGRPPRFPADSKPGMATIMALHREPVGDIPGVPQPMLGILRQCLEPDPARRLPSAAVLRDELGGLLGQPARGASGVASSPSSIRPVADATPPLRDARPINPAHSGPSPANTGPSSPAPATTGPTGPAPVNTGPSGPVPAGSSPTAAPWNPGSPDPSVANSGPVGLSGPMAGTAPPVNHPYSTWPPGMSGPVTAGPATGPTAPFQGTQQFRGSGRQPGGGGMFSTSLHGWRLTTLATAVGGGLALIALAAVLVGNHFLSSSSGQTGAGPTAASGSFGIATTTDDCPAAQVPGAGARCPAAPECWAGIVNIEGNITISSLPCAGPHTFQTFAIGIMPASAATFNADALGNNPTVRSVCSSAVMRQSQTSQAKQIPPGKWEIQVVPPDEAAFDTGVRTYRCIAWDGRPNGADNSQFGP
jgi:serine/threonine protein kinase